MFQITNIFGVSGICTIIITVIDWSACAAASNDNSNEKTAC